MVRLDEEMTAVMAVVELEVQIMTAIIKGCTNQDLLGYGDGLLSLRTQRSFLWASGLLCTFCVPRVVPLACAFLIHSYQKKKKSYKEGKIIHKQLHSDRQLRLLRFLLTWLGRFKSIRIKNRSINNIRKERLLMLSHNKETIS